MKISFIWRPICIYTISYNSQRHFLLYISWLLLDLATFQTVHLYIYPVLWVMVSLELSYLEIDLHWPLKSPLTRRSKPQCYECWLPEGPSATNRATNGASKGDWTYLMGWRGTCFDKGQWGQLRVLLQVIRTPLMWILRWGHSGGWGQRKCARAVPEYRLCIYLTLTLIHQDDEAHALPGKALITVLVAVVLFNWQVWCWRGWSWFLGMNASWHSAAVLLG